MKCVHIGDWNWATFGIMVNAENVNHSLFILMVRSYASERRYFLGFSFWETSHDHKCDLMVSIVLNKCGLMVHIV